MAMRAEQGDAFAKPNLTSEQNAGRQIFVSVEFHQNDGRIGAHAIDKARDAT